MVDVRVGSRKMQIQVSGDGVRSVAQPPVVMQYRDMAVIGVVHGVGMMACCTGQHPGWTVFWHQDVRDDNAGRAWAPLVGDGTGSPRRVVRVDSPWAVVLARGDTGAFAAVDTQHKTLAVADASGRAAWCGDVGDVEAAVVCRDGPESFGLLVCVARGRPRSVLAWPLGRRDLDRLRRAAAGVRLPIRYAGEASVTVPPFGGRPHQGWNDYLTAEGVPLGVIMDVGHEASQRQPHEDDHQEVLDADQEADSDEAELDSEAVCNCD